MAARKPKHLASANEAAAQLQSLLQDRERAICAISGFGGSGKSHLATQLQKHFDIRTDQIVRVDRLCSVNPDGPEFFDQIDWTLLRQILHDAKAGLRLKYGGRTYRGRPVEVDETLPKILIVEGIRLLQPDFMPYFDASIWINCPQECALQRAKERDRQQGEDEAEVARWDTDWGPKDRAYFDTYRPDMVATFLYDGYREGDL